MNYKTNIINEFTAELSDRMDADSLRLATNTLTTLLANYEIQPKCTELAVIDTESEMLLKKFLATKRLEGRSEKTVERYRYIIQRFSDEMNLPYKDVDVYALRLYLATLTQNGCSDNTVNGIRAIFSSFFSWLHDEGFLDSDPSANLGAIKCKKVIRLPYSNVELEQIKANCTTQRDRAIVEFLLSTGCRIDEMTSLNITDINFSTQEAKVLGKGNKERVVYINDVASMHLRKYLSSRSDSNDALFVGKGDIRLNNGGVRAMLKRIEASSGVENVHPHRFRRTLATNLIQKGMAVQDVAAILGHANINTTMTYIHMDADNVKNTCKKLVS